MYICALEKTIITFWVFFFVLFCVDFYSVCSLWMLNSYWLIRSIVSTVFDFVIWFSLNAISFVHLLSFWSKHFYFFRNTNTSPKRVESHTQKRANEMSLFSVPTSRYICTRKSSYWKIVTIEINLEPQEFCLFSQSKIEFEVPKRQIAHHQMRPWSHWPKYHISL